VVNLFFTTLSKWAGQLGEISTGMALLALLVLGKKLSSDIADKAFYIANLRSTLLTILWE